MILYRLLGEDQYIVSLSSKKERAILKVSGFIFMLIILITFFSLTYIFAAIFNVFFFVGLISAFSTFIVYNIYKLCLITIKAYAPKNTLAYSISFIIRLFFVGLIGLFISQGFLMILYDFYIEPIHFQSASIIDIINNTLSENYLVFIIKPFFLLFFITPFFLKISIKKNSPYAVQSRDISKRIISDEYDLFKVKYSEIFKEKFNKDIIISSYYLDPPFNTKEPVDDSVYGNNEDFIRHLF